MLQVYLLPTNHIGNPSSHLFNLVDMVLEMDKVLGDILKERFPDYPMELLSYTDKSKVGEGPPGSGFI